MHFTKKIKTTKYLFGTILNVLIAIALFKIKDYSVLSILLIGIILNQWMLIMGLFTMLSDKPSFKSAIYFLMKFIILVSTIIYAMQKMPNNIVFITVFYIFQLIILVLSIKRIGK